MTLASIRDDRRVPGVRERANDDCDYERQSVNGYPRLVVDVVREPVQIEIAAFE